MLRSPQNYHKTKKKTLTTQNVNDKFEQKLEKTIEEKITLSINNIVPKVVRECLENVHKGVSETVTQDVKQLWSETLYGSDFPELDKSITTQREADRVAQKETTAKPPTIADAVKQAVVTQKEEERKRDEKRNNLIIYGVPEKVEKDYQTRIKNDNDKINVLYTTINVNSKPKKIYRLGKFEAPNEGETREPRALKVIISEPAEIQAIMENCKNLKGAADHMEKYSVCYGMTKEERDKIKRTSKQRQRVVPKFPKMGLQSERLPPPLVTRNKDISKKGQMNKDTHKKDHKTDIIDHKQQIN